MTLRDELAAVLGPGNDDATAYAQADAVLETLGEWLDRMPRKHALNKLIHEIG